MSNASFFTGNQRIYQQDVADGAQTVLRTVYGVDSVTLVSMICAGHTTTGVITTRTSWQPLQFTVTSIVFEAV